MEQGVTWREGSSKIILCHTLQTIIIYSSSDLFSLHHLVNKIPKNILHKVILPLLVLSQARTRIYYIYYILEAGTWTYLITVLVKMFEMSLDVSLNFPYNGFQLAVDMLWIDQENNPQSEPYIHFFLEFIYTHLFLLLSSHIKWPIDKQNLIEWVQNLWSTPNSSRSLFSHWVVPMMTTTSSWSRSFFWIMDQTVTEEGWNTPMGEI